MTPFTIEVAGQTITDADLTAQDLIDCELFGRSGGLDGWAASNPWAGPLELVNVCAVVLARRSGQTYETVAAELTAATGTELRTLLRRRAEGI